MLKFYTYKLEESSEMAGRCLDAELMHKWLCRLTGSSRQESGLLYMLDTKYMLLHVQSQVPLQTPELQEVGSLDLDTFFSRLHDGDSVSFLLTTLPHKKKNGHISYIVDPYGEKAWVKKRLAEHGFDATSVVPMEKKEVYFRHDTQKKGGNGRITLRSYIVAGQVSDHECFSDAWKTGLGWHKAYGNGLFIKLGDAA